MDIVEQMKYFMEPMSIAIIGATRSTGEGSFNIAENLLNCGFAGKIYPVNPRADQILGLKAYPNVKVIHEDIDLTVIAIPRNTVPQFVKECVEKR